MHQSGYTGELEYADILDSKKKKKRKRNITWFNPPFSEHFKINIDEEFLRLFLNTFLPITDCTRSATNFTSSELQLHAKHGSNYIKA